MWQMQTIKKISPVSAATLTRDGIGDMLKYPNSIIIAYLRE